MSAVESDRQGRLSERERGLLERMFADPTILPSTFKGWMVAYLEGSDLDLPMTAIHGLVGRLSEPVLARVPSGTVLLFAGADAPEHTIALDGSALDRDDHPRLFELLEADPAAVMLGPDQLQLPSPSAPPGLRYVIVT